MKQARSILKAYFETDDYPTSAQFAELIDSFINIVDDSVSIEEKWYELEATFTSIGQTMVIIPADAGKTFHVTDFNIVFVSSSGSPLGDDIDFSLSCGGESIYQKFINKYTSSITFDNTASYGNANMDYNIQCISTGTLASSEIVLKIQVKGYRY